MLVLDLQNAFSAGIAAAADNFDVLMLRLIARLVEMTNLGQADAENLERIRLGFPVLVKAVEIYKNDCPYKDDPSGERYPDWLKIAEEAEKVNRLNIIQTALAEVRECLDHLRMVESQTRLP